MSTNLAAIPDQSWHVVEFLPGVVNGKACNLPNEEPRMLRWLLATHTATHVLVAATRRRAPGGPSMVRLVMDPLQGNGDPLVVHAALVTRPEPAVQA